MLENMCSTKATEAELDLSVPANFNSNRFLSNSTEIRRRDANFKEKRNTPFLQ